MNDLISRQVLRDAMYHEAFEADSDLQKWDGGCWIRYKMFENVIDKIPSAQQWISCSKRLPEEEKEVLVYTAAGEMLVAYLFDDWGNLAWTTGGLGSGTVNVVAWMPLPSPYREGEVID